MLRTPLISRIPISNQHSHISTRNNNGFQTFSCNLLLCCFACGKLLISLGVLLADNSDLSSLKIWLMLQTLSDMISSILLFLAAKTSSRGFFSRSLPRDLADTPQLVDEESQQIRIEQPESYSASKPYKTILTINNIYYLSLWVWGHFIYYQACEDCLKSVQAIANLVFLYLYCGYFYVACSLLMAIFNRSIWSFFSFSPTTLATKSKNLWSNFNSLSLKSYSTDASGTTECYICLVNYNEGDGLAELPCNEKHRFHEACIKKWLKISNACPLCRKTVTGSGEAPHVNEVELPVIA